jgi:hypothetical protein
MRDGCFTKQAKNAERQSCLSLRQTRPANMTGGQTMDVKIRDLPDDAVAKLDDRARRQNKSRQQYLKEQIELLALAPELTEKENGYRNLVGHVLEALIKNTAAFIRFNEILESEEE